MSVIGRLQLAGCGLHVADQIALVGVPVVAALAFDASPKTLGVLVACQSLAHLLGALPSGLIVDRRAPRPVAIGAVFVAMLGAAGAAVGVATDTIVAFGAGVTAAGFGLVLFTLTALSVLPRAVPADTLAQANARIELPRTAASFAVPLTLGVIVSAETLGWIFVAAVAATLPALWAVAGLPHYVPGKPNAQSPLRRIADGGSFVLGNGFLRAIAACALFWNFAFSALLVTMVPLVTDAFLMEPGIFGIAMACFGLAAFAGSGTAARYAGRIRPNLLLLFGPASSVPAVLLLLTVEPSGSPFAIYAAFFGLGFGPAMWLIVQNSVRQIVSPRDMLGRVNAMIQTTIYGARPLGALCGGFLVAATTPRDALAFIAACFALSFAVAAISRLRTIRSYGDLAAAEAG